jgi:para-aminobenzoate synthetase component I
MNPYIMYNRERIVLFIRSVNELSKALQHKRILHSEIPTNWKHWFEKYKDLTVNQTNHILLESGRGGRYSIMGTKPTTIINGKGNELRITSLKSSESTVLHGDLLVLLKEYMATYNQYNIPNLPDFQGGILGYISYDIARQIESLPQNAVDDLQLPDLFFMEFEDIFVFDHSRDTVFIIVTYDELISEDKLNAAKRLAAYVEDWPSLQEKPIKEEIEIHETTLNNELSYSMSEEQFKDAVKRVQSYIKEGDVFQVNLSVRQTQPLHTDPIAIYENLREINPSPYMGYLHSSDFQLVSGSPELLVKKKGLDLSTRPIAGTRSRGKDEIEDDQLAKTLIENEKERAEHLMLVDLERNDLGRVSQYGSVEVNEFMVIEKYSHVQHIVSNVRGMIKPEFDAYDAIRATFPGGTITGAPKIRTMEIIEELEPVRRGVYTGSIGWIGYNGDMELNIAIRTMVVKDKEAHVQAGAGIVIDSSPQAEYKESLKKARALWNAKELSEAEKFEKSLRRR